MQTNDQIDPQSPLGKLLASGAKLIKEEAKATFKDYLRNSTVVMPPTPPIVWPDESKKD